MGYLITILIFVLLFLIFLLLTVYEAGRGVRFFASSRYRLDTKVGRAFFVMRHVDWGAWSAHLTKTTLEVIAHDVAHGTLMAVRTLERGLTRTVRWLRMRRDGTLPPLGEGRSRIERAITHVKRSFDIR